MSLCCLPVSSLRVAASTLAASTALFLGGCASTLPEPDLAPRKETLVAVTASNQLIRFNAGQPRKLLSKVAISGLAPGDQIAAIDYRVHRGELYALAVSTTRARLFKLNPTTGAATPVGPATGLSLTGEEFGLDFNPTVDRIRLVSTSGWNARLHPDTGVLVDSNPTQEGVQIDGDLVYAPGDPNAGKPPRIAAAAYTYNKQNDKLTTNFAIDAALDLLVTQGSREGTTPVVSPNTGQLFSVGVIGFGSAQKVAFDIADVTGAGFAAFTKRDGADSKLYLIDLATGTGTFLGTIGGGEVVRGIAVDP